MARKITVVIEFNCPDDTPTHGVYTSAHGIEGIVSDCLSDRLPAEFGFRIMETIAAPYGAQHIDGVWMETGKAKL